jgi:hypothetical protein
MKSLKKSLLAAALTTGILSAALVSSALSSGPATLPAPNPESVYTFSDNIKGIQLDVQLDIMRGEVTFVVEPHTPHDITVMTDAFTPERAVLIVENQGQIREFPLGKVADRTYVVTLPVTRLTGSEMQVTLKSDGFTHSNPQETWSVARRIDY